jgi:hypothetical protein
MELDVILVRLREAHYLIWTDSDALRRLYGSSAVVGFDASGHVAEELKNAR